MDSLTLGVGPALALGLGFGMVITAGQGFLVGYLRANPIILSIAAMALLLGTTDFLTGGQRIYSPTNGLGPLTGNLWGIPVEVLFLMASVGAGQIILSYTRFGRHIHMVGSNPQAAQAAGVSIWRTVTASYLLAGLFVALSGILLSARYGSGDMELGVGYDYDAIAAVLVGGNAIHGGQGSVIRTLLGVAVVSAIQVVLLLHGFNQQIQYLMTGLMLLTVIIFHSLGESHS
jgi:ribose/xylose/arabinose/galactoside ABC-type transport system permease subunit